MKRELLDALNEKRAAGKPVAVATLLNSCDQWLIDSSSDGGATKKIADVVRSAIAEDRSQLIQLDGSELFVQVHNPPLRMVIVGAVHIAQSLSLMAVETGYM